MLSANILYNVKSLSSRTRTTLCFCVYLLIFIWTGTTRVFGYLQTMVSFAANRKFMTFSLLTKSGIPSHTIEMSVSESRCSKQMFDLPLDGSQLLAQNGVFILLAHSFKQGTCLG